MAVDRRALWLGGVLIAAVVAVMAVRSMNEPPATPSSPSPRARAQTTPGATSDAEMQPIDVNLEALTRARGEPVDQGRNPFRFQPKPQPKPIAPPPTSFPGSSNSGNDSGFAPMPPPKPAGPPPPPPITLKFIGLVGKVQDGKIVQIAVLSDGRNTDSGTEGKIVFGQYQILKIGTESIDMAYVDGRGRQTIRLTGQ